MAHPTAAETDALFFQIKQNIHQIRTGREQPCAKPLAINHSEPSVYAESDAGAAEDTE